MRKKTIKTTALFITAILSILMMITPLSAGAVKSPQMNVIRGSNGFNVVWNKVYNTRAYRLYLGVNGKWRCYTEINVTQEEQKKTLTTHPVYTQSYQFFIDWNALHYRKWVPYGQEAGTPTAKIEAPNAYCCQIEAINGKKQHVVWSNVDFALYGTPTLQKTITGNNLKLNWNAIKGANAYRIAHKSSSAKSYDYTLLHGTNTTSYTFYGYGKPSENQMFQIQPCIVYKNAIYEYGKWSSTLTVKPTPVLSPAFSPNYGDYVGSLTAESVGIYNAGIVLGVDQATIDNYEIGMYFCSTYVFGDNGVTLFGHNNKKMGNIKNLKIGNIVTINDKLYNRTLKYKVYYVGECRKSSDSYYLTDIHTGQIIEPFSCNNTTDLLLATCHDNLWNTDYCVRAKRI